MSPNGLLVGMHGEEKSVVLSVISAESLSLSYESFRGGAPHRVWEWSLLWNSTKAFVHPEFVSVTVKVTMRGVAKHKRSEQIHS